MPDLGSSRAPRVSRVVHVAQSFTVSYKLSANPEALSKLSRGTPTFRTGSLEGGNWHREAGEEGTMERPVMRPLKRGGVRRRRRVSLQQSMTRRGRVKHEVT